VLANSNMAQQGMTFDGRSVKRRTIDGQGVTRAPCMLQLLTRDMMRRGCRVLSLARQAASDCCCCRLLQSADPNRILGNMLAIEQAFAAHGLSSHGLLRSRVLQNKCVLQSAFVL
jgi:hypothetical protein